MSKKLIYFVSFVLVLTLILTSVGNAAKKPNLIGWWKFDSDTLDYSGLGNDGTAFGNPTFVTGKVGSGALEFDGDDYIRMDGLADDITDNDCTLHAWVKTTDNAGDWFSCNTGTGGNVALWAIDSSQAAMYEGSYQARSTTNVSDGQWHMLTFTRIGSVGTTYVDGVAENTYTANFNFSTTDRWSIAQEWDSDSPSDFLSGTVDDVRFYDRELSAAQVQDLFNGIDPTWLKAEYPNPADGAFHADTWASLSWSPGDTAVSHDVYFSDNFDDVNASAEGASHGNQPSTSFVVGFPGFPYPDGLIPGTTYCWRVDEVEADGTTIHKGDVWSFAIPPRTAYSPDPADTAESIDPNAVLSWTGGFGTKLHYVYFGDNFDDVSNAAGGLPQGTATYSPGTLKFAKTYYWRVDEFDVIETHKGNVWSFTTEGAVAALNPANGAVDVTQTPVLTWAPGFGASHEVYFGADASSLENKGSGNLGSESYDPGQLEWNTTYYWRVDEANNANADSPWTGPLWSFTTANFLIVDDMESYNDINEGEPGSNRIYLAWVDGFDNPATNGSVVGNANPPFAEQTIVHGGLQSMPMSYDNAVGKSEATLTLTSNRNWTENGVNTLTIWYIGDAANAPETMYVVLNGSAGVDNDNPNAAQVTAWTRWDIDLTRFADQGVNLANVSSITLGLSSVTGGTGMMYFDDIRLYPPAQ